MSEIRRLLHDHLAVSRRYFFALGRRERRRGTRRPPWRRTSSPLLEEAASQLEFLTPLERIKPDGRGNPSPHTLSPAELREVGLDSRDLVPGDHG